MKKQFAVVGMGRFGLSVARTLHGLGFEVLAIDGNEHRIQEVSSQVTRAIQADCTDEDTLRSIGIRNFDVVVVAIGQDIQASILATLILKELGVPQIVVKAQNELHGKVLKRIGADKIVYPERDMGQRVAHHLVSVNILEFIELSDDYGIVEIKASRAMIGKNLLQLDIRAKHHCNVIAMKDGAKMNIAPHAEDIITPQDILVVVGTNEDLKAFELYYSE